MPVKTEVERKAVREWLKDSKIVQNITGGGLTLPDLGKMGTYMRVDEIMDFSQYYDEKEVMTSRALQSAFDSGQVQVLKAMNDPKAVKTKKKSDSYSKDAQVIDGPNVYDELYKGVVEKQKQEDIETRASER